MAAGINSMQSFVRQIMLVLRDAIGGYGLSPSDEELINYLKSENPGNREDFCIIPRIGNIYEINPWDLPERFNEKSIIPSNGREWWFICPHMQNQRNCRKTPSDYSWKITGKSTDIKIDGQKIGSKKIFVFPEGRGSKGSKSSKSLWLIHEYRLPDENICKSDRDYVLCHLKLKQDELCLPQTDDVGSLPKLLIQETMESLRKSAQHQNRAQFSLPDLLQLFQRGLQSQNNSFRLNIHQFTNTGSSSVKNFSLDDGLTDKDIKLQSLLGTTKDDRRVDSLLTEDPFDDEVQKGEEPRVEKVHQETTARNIGPCMSSYEAEAIAKHVIQARMETQRQSTQHQHPAEFSSRDLLHLAQPGLHSQNNSFHSNTHQLTNTGSSSVKNFSLDDSLTDKSIELKSLLGTTKDHERVDTLSNENRFDAEVQKGEAPRLEKVQQETAARNIRPWISSNEATARAELNRNYAPSHLKHKQDDSRTDNAGSFPEHVIQARMETQRQSTQHQNPAEFSSRDLLHLVQPGLHSQNNSSDADLSFAQVQNGEEPHKSIQFEFPFFRTKDEEWADSLIVDYSFDTEVQNGEEPCFEKVQQELEHEEYNLAGNPSKRRRLEVSEENQIQ